MKTYSILLAQDIPHYGAAEIDAADAALALERAEALDVSEIALDPDWENPVCLRIVHVVDEAGAEVAHDIALDGYVLHHVSEPRTALCDQAPALRAALEGIAETPLWGEPIADPALRADYIDSGEYDGKGEAFEPSADTESSLLQEVVEAARTALAAVSDAQTSVHAGIRVFVEGGVVQRAETLDGKPARVEVVDYDVCGSDPAELDTDAAGKPCRRFVT